jgi:hypothetical protein
MVAAVEGASMGEHAQAEVDAVVAPSGDVVISAESVRQLALVPGQRVQVVINVPAPRRNMYGVLAGRLPDDISPDDLAEVRREVWSRLTGLTGP